MPILVPVQPYSNGEYINQDVLNRPLTQMNTNIDRINYRVDTLLQDDIVSTTEGWSSSKIKFEFDNFSPNINVFNDAIVSPDYGWSSQKIASLLTGSGPIDPTIFNPFNDDIVSTEYGWTSSKIRFELDQCCSGTGSTGIRTPTPIYPISGETNVPQGVELTADAYYHYTAVARQHRVFQIDYSDGTFTVPLYEFSVNSDSHAITYTLDKTKTYKWRCKDVDIEGDESGWSLPQVFSSSSETVIPAPILKKDILNDLPSTINETEILSVLISNYDAQYSYIVQVTDGTHSGSGATYSWQMPEVTADKIISFSARATDGAGSFSATTTHFITVLNVEVSSTDDDVIQVTDYVPVDSLVCVSDGFVHI